MGWKEDRIVKLDSLFEGLRDWLLGQYDQHSGGFYYARSSRDNVLFTPDIESTAQGLNILDRHQLLEGMPHSIKQHMIHFFQEKQDKQSGYFYDLNSAMKLDEVMVHRALAYTIRSLTKLGATYLYPLPMALHVAPTYTESIDRYKEKWNSIDLCNSWRGCDLLASSTVYMSQMDEEKREQYAQAFADYLANIQDKETGLWGEGSLYVKISGTFKLHTFYRRFQIPMPNQSAIYESIKKCLLHEEAVDMCYIRNPIDLLSYLSIDIAEKDLQMISEITIDNMAKLKQSDGGFQRELIHSPKAPNVAQVKEGEYYPDMPEPVQLGLGLVEGDMNATTQATLIRMQLHRLLQKSPKKVIDENEFWMQF